MDLLSTMNYATLCTASLVGFNDASDKLNILKCVMHSHFQFNRTKDQFLSQIFMQNITWKKDKRKMLLISPTIRGAIATDLKNWCLKSHCCTSHQWKLPTLSHTASYLVVQDDSSQLTTDGDITQWEGNVARSNPSEQHQVHPSLNGRNMPQFLPDNRYPSEDLTVNFWAILFSKIFMMEK